MTRKSSKLFRPSFTALILWGLALGITCGLFFGEYCAQLKILGDAFVGLLRMTVMPYIIISLIANLGKLSRQQSRRLARVGGTVLVFLWAIALLTVFALANTLPQWKAGSFFSTAVTESPSEFDLVALFIPSNIFASLAENHVPAVVLLSICVGLALSGMNSRNVLITQLDIISSTLVRVNSFFVRLAPVAVFAMSASAAGTISVQEAGRLQAYIVAYTAGAVFLAFVALPCLITSLTDLRYREVISVSKDAMVTAFATGKLIVVLPLLIEQTEKLFEKHKTSETNSSAPAIDVLYPAAYAFPHVGKLLTILFVPFAAWFLGSAFDWHEYPMLLSAGAVSYFGGPILAIPFLLDLMQLPHDMFQLFLLSGVYGERVGDALGVMHLVTFTLLSTCAFLGRLRIRLWPLARYVVTMAALGISIMALLRIGLSQTLKYVEGKEEIIVNMQLLEEPVSCVVLRTATPNPRPLLLGESILERIKRRGVIRIGYDEDKLPFAYFNIYDELVGFDANMAHAFATDLGVTIEFVRFDRATLAEQLAQDHFDVVMSGLVGTLERSRTMQHTSSYMDVNLGLVVPDYQVRQFRSLKSLREQQNLRIGFVDLSRGFVGRLQAALPQVELVELNTNQQYFDHDWKELDALLISAESGSAFTLLYPDFEVVIPTGLEVSLPLFYAIGARDAEMASFMEHWVGLRRKDGTMQEYYDHWILGKTSSAGKKRWSVIRDVLHWVD